MLYYLFWIKHAIPSWVRYPKEILDKAAKKCRNTSFQALAGFFENVPSLL